MSSFNTLQRSYEPRRLFKYKDSLARDEAARFLGTLLEYEANLHGYIQNTNAEVFPSKSTAASQDDRKDDHVCASNDEKVYIYHIRIRIYRCLANRNRSVKKKKKKKISLNKHFPFIRLDGRKRNCGVDGSYRGKLCK